MRCLAILPRAVLLAFLLAAPMACPAAAQQAVPNGTWTGSGVTIGQEPFKRPEKKKDFIMTSAPATRGAEQSWPRLDPGAVLCRTQDDLEQHMAQLAGAPAESGAAQCQRIRNSTPIAIVARHGPGRTEVKVAGNDGPLGWTDAWLPDKKPAGP